MQLECVKAPIEIANPAHFWHNIAMKNLLAAIGVSLFALATRAALPQPDLILQIHFAGAQRISATQQSRAFTNEFCSPEAVALRAQTATRLADWLSGWLQANLAASVPNGAAKLRPLFDDLQKSEFFLEIRAAANGQPEAAIAINLDAPRAQLWQANLKPFFATATFKSTGSWLFFDSNPALLGLGDRLAKRISAPAAGWFDLDVNWPLLARWYPVLQSLALPETQFQVTAPADFFYIAGKFFYPQNLALNLDPWRVPTNTVHEPFTSFTAVRGFASWFQSQPWAQPYQITPAPSQLFVWSLPQFRLQTFAAIPVPDAARALSQANARLAPAIAAADARDAFLSPLATSMAANDLAITGMPFAAPHLRALTEPAGQFLFWETFPNPPTGRPFPPGLLHTLAQNNLVLYHWEITADRMPQLLHVLQLGLMITGHKQLEAQTAAFKWMQKSSAKMAISETQIAQSGPAELTFARKSPGIFTAAEMFALASWLEATNFPGCDLSMPPGFTHSSQAPGAPTQRTISLPAPAPAHSPVPAH